MTVLDQPATSGPIVRPQWVRWLDTAVTTSVVLLGSAILTGGPRVRFGDFRVTAESPWKIALVLGALLGLRAAFWRRDTWWQVAAARLRQSGRTEGCGTRFRGC